MQIYIYINTGRMMRYRVMSCHGMSVRYHKSDMAMIAHIDIIYISVTRYGNDFLPIINYYFKEIS
jgi:hypothetical protein